MIFKEFELENDHLLVSSLNKMLEWARSSEIPNIIRGEDGHCDLSEECLQKRINNEFPNRCWMSRFDHHEDYDFNNIQRHTEQVYKEQTGIDDYILIPVAKTWYPEGGGYLGWHVDSEGGRMYSTWSDGESFFRYRDPNTKEVITSYDKPHQWTFRVFSFDDGDPVWHCVYAKDARISVGYRFK